MRQLERVDFQDDSGKTYQTFQNVSATRPADTNAARKGFGIDLNGDGRYSSDTDGLLAFDLDGDGKYTSTDVENTSKYLRALSGEQDLDGDGRVSFQERSDAHNMIKQFGSADLDQDGVLQGWEISELGGMVVKLGNDADGNPTSSIQNLPGFEADRQPPQSAVSDPLAGQRQAEFDAWRNQMLGQWSAVLGMDLSSVFNSSPGASGGGLTQQFQFPPVSTQMFGFGLPQQQQQFNFPQFNFQQFDPMAGQSFDANGFPSFFSTGLGFL